VRPVIDWTKAHFFITCVGMADAWMRSFEADHRTWTILQGDWGATLIPFRSEGSDPTSLDEALFIA